MPVSYENQFIFFHIPRCGGTSVETYFNYNKGNPLHGVIKQGEDYLTLHHLPYNEIHRKNFIEPQLLTSFYKFTIIRDPFRRMVSDYIWQQNYDVNDEIKYLSFQEYLDKAEWVINENKYFEKVHYDHYRPMVDYCYSDQEMILDEILILEKIKLELPRIQNVIKVDSLPTVNSSGHTLDLFCDKKNIDRVYSLYQQDKEMFDKLFRERYE